MPKSPEKVFKHLSETQRKVIEAVALLASITLSEVNPSVGVGNVIKSIEHHDGISRTRTALDELVEQGVLVKEIREGSPPQFKFSKAVVHAGGFRWIMKQLASQRAQ